MEFIKCHWGGVSASPPSAPLSAASATNDIRRLPASKREDLDDPRSCNAFRVRGQRWNVAAAAAGIAAAAQAAGSAHRISRAGADQSQAGLGVVFGGLPRAGCSRVRRRLQGFRPVGSPSRS